MSNFGTMVSRMQRETRRNTDEDIEQIKDEIISALHDYRMLRFPWNEREFTITTSDGTYEYDFPTQDVDSNTIDLLELDNLKVSINSTWYPMEQRPIKIIEEYKYSDTNNKSWPYLFAIHNKQFVLYPIPNDTYTLRGRAFVDINTITADSDDSATNAWFTYGERLIRNRAKTSLFRNYIGNPERAAEARSEEQEALQALFLYKDRLYLAGDAVPWC